MRKDWPLIKNDYITTPITQEELSKKHKVSRQQVSRHCVDEKWEELRAEFVLKSSQDSQVSRIEDKVTERESFIKAIETVINLKLKAEERILLKSQSLENLKVLSSIVSKSKNNIPELTKIVELLKGNATERTEVSEQEKKERIDRLSRYRTASLSTEVSSN